MPLTGQIFTHVLSNPGAELGNNSGWIYGDGNLSFMNVASSVGTNLPWEGGWFYAGGSGYVNQRQTVFPTSDGVPEAAIDSLRASFTYRGQTHGEATNNDFSIPKVNFYTATGSFLGSYIGTHSTNVNSWQEFILEALIPPNTRQIDVVMNAERNTGPGANGYYDSNSCYSTIVYSTSYVMSGIAQGSLDADVGSLAGWSVISGGFIATQSSAVIGVIPRVGSFCFAPNSSNFSLMEYLVDVHSLSVNTQAWQDGYVDLCLSHFYRINDHVDDVGRVILRVLDAASNFITSTSASIQRNWPGGRGTNPRSEWSFSALRVNMPANARLLSIQVDARKLTGISNHFYTDAISLWMVTGSKEAGAGPGAARRAFPSGLFSGRDFPNMQLREVPHD